MRRLGCPSSPYTVRDCEDGIDRRVQRQEREGAVMAGMWLRARVWLANLLLDLGFPIRMAKAIVPEIEHWRVR